MSRQPGHLVDRPAAWAVVLLAASVIVALASATLLVAELALSWSPIW
ncbi:MAG TPA: hypothetical protein VJU34_03685 [Phenylobacterium sp.]|nr:hypothetical protein [Phenylobacterium sp.]